MKIKRPRSFLSGIQSRILHLYWILIGPSICSSKRGNRPLLNTLFSVFCGAISHTIKKILATQSLYEIIFLKLSQPFVLSMKMLLSSRGNSSLRMKTFRRFLFHDNNWIFPSFLMMISANPSEAKIRDQNFTFYNKVHMYCKTKRNFNMNVILGFMYVVKIMVFASLFFKEIYIIPY